MTKQQRSALWQRWQPVAVLVFAAGCAWGASKLEAAHAREVNHEQAISLIDHETRISGLEACQAGIIATNESILRELATLNTNVAEINSFLREYVAAQP